MKSDYLTIENDAVCEAPATCNEGICTHGIDKLSIWSCRVVGLHKCQTQGSHEKQCRCAFKKQDYARSIAHAQRSN